MDLYFVYILMYFFSITIFCKQSFLAILAKPRCNSDQTGVVTILALINRIFPNSAQT